MENLKFEICSGSLQSALNAQEAGAHRVELCSALSLGGLTPSYGFIELAKKRLKIDVNVLIRPRQGDFLYDSKNSESASLTWKEAGNIALRAVGSAAIGFSSSILGTAATKMPLNGLQEEGALLIFRGKTGAGCLTKTQARNLIKQGETLINTTRGISSVVGTIATWPLSTALSVSFL